MDIPRHLQVEAVPHALQALIISFINFNGVNLVDCFEWSDFDVSIRFGMWRHDFMIDAVHVSRNVISVHVQSSFKKLMTEGQVRLSRQ